MLVTLTDLFLAYRQAKIAVFNERRGAGLESFAKYEAKLETRLRSLLALDPGTTWFDKVSLGTVWLAPKSVRPTTPAPDTGVHHVGAKVRDGSRALDVRVIVTPLVDFHIVEILYLWHFGPALNALLQKCSVGYRLKRRTYMDDKSRCQQHVFEFWPKTYQAFRSDAMDAARSILKRKPYEPCIIASLDLRSFYDSVAPEFLLEDQFVSEVERAARWNGIGFDESEYRTATASLIDVYRKQFHAQAVAITGTPIARGVPIGTLTSRLVANVALASLDERILGGQDVVCYRRYVDDLIVVAMGEVAAGTTKEDVFARWIPFATNSGNPEALDEAALGRPASALRVNLRKSRVYVLQGPEGLDLLDAVDSDVARLVSEQRSFLDTTILSKRTLAEVLSAAEPHQSTLHVLREDDREHLANWGMSVALRSLERIADLVDPEEARKFVRSKLRPIIRALVSADDWVKRMDVALRVLRLAIRVEDAESVRELLDATEQVWGLGLQQRELYWDGVRATGADAVGALRRYLQQRRLEAVCSALLIRRPSALSDLSIRARDRILSRQALARLANQFGAADLRMRDREDEASQNSRCEYDHTGLQLALEMEGRLLERFNNIREFVEACRRASEPAWQMEPLNLFLSVHPPRYFDVARHLLALAEIDGYQQNAFLQIERVVNAIRGTLYDGVIGSVIAPDHVVLSVRPDEVPAARLILGNLSVDEECFAGVIAKVRTPVLSLKRARRLGIVLERARVVAKQKLPDGSRPPQALLTLPELSIPREWLRLVSNYVVKLGSYSLAMGLEYLRHAANPWVYNQVLGVFVGTMGAVAPVIWTKHFAATHEAEEIKSKHLHFAPPAAATRRTVVSSQFGKLSVLICSELIEARRVADLVGRVELLLVPSWNKDLASYDHLIQSVGFQVHSILAIANNGTFSDCRAWAPVSERPLRELCRLIERDSNDVVWTDVPVGSLRAFHEGTPGAWRPLPPGWQARK